MVARTYDDDVSDLQDTNKIYTQPNFRWTANVVPDEICFEAIKAGVDQLPPGVKMLLNSGVFRSVES